MQKNPSFPIHYSYEVLPTDTEGNLNIKLRPKYKFGKEHHKNCYSLIAVDEKKWFDICFLSRGQSECALWFRERFIRINCSSRAHRIRTRKDESAVSLMILVEQFVKQQHKSAVTQEMLYGLKMEKRAKIAFEEFTGLEVFETGLIVSINQPFLTCSPDGIIFNSNNCELLEIKCPFTCKNAKIVNREERRSFVPYLQFDEAENVILKKSNVYYTQIQVSMYILGISLCHFFVFPEVDSISLIVARDEDFLSDVVPKMEKFYFEYFFPSLKQAGLN